MSIWQHAGRIAVGIFYAAPWAWLVCFAVFVIGVMLEVGHFPAYSNPDPKHVEGLESLYFGVVVLLFMSLASPVIVALHVLVRAVFWPAWPFETLRLVIYALGAGLVAWVILGNPAGLASWLAD